MRFIRRNPRIKPSKLKQPAVIAEWVTIANTGNKGLIKSANYADPYNTADGRRSRVIDVLDKWYFGKCAYCEKTCKADVEHYRPSKSVRDINNQLVAGHNGYYWLCYEWTNLIPSCANCNREGAKYDKFPVLAVHRNTPKLKRNGDFNKQKCKSSDSYLSAERPVLLHPEIDDPNTFFEFDIDPNNEGIILVGTDADNRGRDSIKICLLNRRELKIDRHKQVVLDFADSIHAAFAARKANTIPTDTALKIQIEAIIQSLYTKSRNDEYTHTLLRRYIVGSAANFQKIIIPYIDSSYQGIIQTAFTNYTPY